MNLMCEILLAYTLRGKVFLADVEKEVMLELASSVMTASTPLSSSIQSTMSVVSASLLTTNSPQVTVTTQCMTVATGTPTADTVTTATTSPISLSETTRSLAASEPDKQQKLKFPQDFEIRHKKEKSTDDSSLSSTKCSKPVKIVSSLSPPFENLIKPLHLYSTTPDASTQSPCKHQENLFKEGVNIQEDHPIQQKPLIHPNFLVSEKTFLSTKPSIILSDNKAHQSNEGTKPISHNDNGCTEPGPVESLDKLDPNDAHYYVKLQDGILTNQSKLEESSQLNTQQTQKGYDNLKKSFLTYESLESELKEKEKSKEKKSRSKSTKHKESCRKCQNRHSESHKDQYVGTKSFHIQAYKAYKNRNRESYVIGDPDVASVTNSPTKSKSEETNNTQNSIQFLKPCEDVIALYETSHNPNMTSSYPMVAQDKKNKQRNHPVKVPVMINAPMSTNANNCKPNTSLPENKTTTKNEKKLNENINWCHFSGIFYEGDKTSHRNSSIFLTDSIPTNNLSQPTNHNSNCDYINMTNAQWFNVSLPKNLNDSMSSSECNKRYSHNDALSADIPFSIDKDVKLQKHSKAKINSHQIVSKPENSQISQLTKNSSINSHRKSPITTEPERFVLKEDKEYFDYKYRLCYVDSNCDSADLNFCATCQGGKDLIDKALPLSNNIPHSQHRKDCKSSVVQKVENGFEAINTCKMPGHDLNSNVQKSRIETSKSVTRCSVSSQSDTKSKTCKNEGNQANSRSIYPCMSKIKTNASTTTWSSDISSPLNCSKTSSKIMQSSNTPSTICSFNSTSLNQPCNNKKPYKLPNNTLETFSSSMSQPIFSVLPFERCNNEKANLKPQKPLLGSQAVIKKDFISINKDATTISQRILKERMKANESSRLSTCSTQSGNEVHILQLNDVTNKSKPCSPETVSHSLRQGNFIHSSGKDVEQSTLQVRYIPKHSTSPTKLRKVQTTAHAQIRPDSDFSNVDRNSRLSTLLSNPLNRPAASTVSANHLTHSSSNQPSTFPNDPHPSNANDCPSSYSASGLSSPDLLQVSVIQPGSVRKSNTCDQSPLQKKPSFFARFTQSPLSLFYKDTKNNGTK